MDYCYSIIYFMALGFYYVWRYIDSFVISDYFNYNHYEVNYREEKNMKHSEKALKNSKDKFKGKIAEAVGELTGNEQLELKGKLQVAKVDFKNKIDVKEKVENAKEGIAKKLNNHLDKNTRKHK